MSDLPFPDDELVSAYLDGEVDADARARVESDPALMARVEELDRVRGLVRAPVTEPATADVDRAVAAALAASRPHPVRSLEERRRPSSVPAWLSVAALIIALLVAVPVVGGLLGGGDDSEDSAETAALDSADEEASTLESDDAGGGAEQGPTADADTSFQAAGPVDLGDLGAIADERALAEAIGPEVTARRALLEEQGETAGGSGEDGTGSAGEDSPVPSTTTVPSAAGAAAPPPRCDRPDLGEPVLRATAVYGGTEAVVFVYETDETRVVVLAVDSCGVIADFTL